MVNCTAMITSLDIFGTGIKLTINKKESSQTLIGGIASILSLLVVIVFGIYTAQDLYLRRDPNVSRIDYSNTKYNSFYANNISFPIAFKYEGRTDYTKFLSITAKYFVYNNIEQDYEINRQIHFHNCTKEDFPDIEESKFKNFICFDNYNFSIFGAFSEERTGYVTLYISKCDSTQYECWDDVEISETINEGSYFNILIKKPSISPFNYSTPISYYLDSHYLLWTDQITKINELYIKEEYIETDDGILWKNHKEQYSYAIEKEIVNFMDTTGITLGRVTWYASNKTTKTKRIFAKIQNILADIGGIVSIVWNSVPIAVMMFSITRRDENIWNNLIDFDVQNEQKIHYRKSALLNNANNSRNQKENLRSGGGDTGNVSIINATSNNWNEKGHKSMNKGNSWCEWTNISGVNNDVSGGVSPKKWIQSDRTEKNWKDHSWNNGSKSKENILLNHENNIIQYNSAISTDAKVKHFLEKNTEKINNQLHFGFCEILKMYLCPCCSNSITLKKKKSLYDKSRRVIENYWEITYLITKLDELEKMKFVLFTKEQLSLFKFISADVCSVDQQKMENNPIHKTKMLFENIEYMAKTCFEYKDNIEGCGKAATKIDLRWLELLTDKMRSYD